MTPPLLFRYRLSLTHPLPCRCSGRGPGPTGSPSPVLGGRCGSPTAPSRSSRGAPSPPPPPVRVLPPPLPHRTLPDRDPPAAAGGCGHRAPHPRRTGGGAARGGWGCPCRRDRGVPAGCGAAGPGGGRSRVPPCVRPCRKWPGNGSRLLRLVVFETSFLIRSRHAPGASRCHRAGAGRRTGGGPSSLPEERHRLHGTDSSPPAWSCGPPSSAPGDSPGPSVPAGIPGASGCRCHRL